MRTLPCANSWRTALVLLVTLIGLLSWVFAGSIPGSGIPGHSGLARPDSAGSGQSSHRAAQAGASSPPAGPSFQWTDISTAHMPGPRLDGGLVFDSADGYVLLFGGENDGTIPAVYYNDTWTFSGGHWTNVTNPQDAPSKRTGFVLADDPADHEVVLFGGLSSTGQVLDDTWTYHGGVWTNITSSLTLSPEALFWAAMAYDNATGTVILFGGQHASIPGEEYTNDTWSFHAGAWTELTPTVSPPARNSESLTFDGSDNEFLMFGGQNESGPFNDTWAFTGSTWEEPTTTGAPDPRWGVGLAYYGAESEVVLYGGSEAINYDVYTYHAGVWTEYSASPNPGQTLGLVQMTYDWSDRYVLLFQETTSYTNVTWALNVTSVPPPALTVQATAAPLSGTIPFQVDFTSTISGGVPPYTVNWSFGDSSANVSGSPSTAGNTSHTYSTGGTFNASVTVTDSAADHFTKNWTITASVPVLTLAIKASPTNAMINETVTFTASPSGGTPPYTFAWTFGDGGTSSSQNATHAYTAAGSYIAKLVLTDSKGLSVSKNVTISVTQAGPVSTTSTSDWWIYAVGAVVVILVVIAVLFVTRRRKREPPATPASSQGGPPSPPGPPTGGPSE